MIIHSISSNVFLYQSRYVQCKDLKDYKDLKERKHSRYIILSSFESLEAGMSNKILPEVIKDVDYNILILNRSYKNSLVRNLIMKVKENARNISHVDITRKVIETHPEEITKEEETIKRREQEDKPKDAKQEHVYDLSNRKKLFAKSPYLMFAYHNKRKLTDYGVV